MKYSILILILLVHQGLSLFLILGEKERRCFFEEYEKDVMLKMTFRASVYNKDSATGLVVTVSGPDRRILLKKEYASNSVVSFSTSEPGVYALCLSTDSTKWAMYAKDTIMVHFRFEEEYIHDDSPENHGISIKKKRRPSRASSNDDDKDADDETDDFSMEGQLEAVKKDVTWIKEMQSYYRSMDDRFREIAEVTNSRVLKWAVAQLLLLVITGWWQLRSLGNFFKEKKLV